MGSPGKPHRQTGLRHSDSSRRHWPTAQGVRRGTQDRRPAAMSDAHREALAVRPRYWNGPLVSFSRGEKMVNAVAYPHIIKEDGKPARLERHPRIRVAQLVMDYLAYGWS